MQYTRFLPSMEKRMQKFLRSSIALATFAVCGLAMQAQAQVSVIAEINRPGKNSSGVTGNGTTYNATYSGKFVFNTVPSNSYFDLLTGLTATIVTGARNTAGGAITVLTNGACPNYSAGTTPSDQPATNFFASASCRFVFNLGVGGKPISQINSYSWHKDDGNATTTGIGDRAPQVYSVYGAPDGVTPDNTNLTNYTLIATVDTSATGTTPLAAGSAVLGNSGQHGVSISGVNATYRYLLFDTIQKTGQSPTFFSEIDAIAPASALSIVLTAAPGPTGVALSWTTPVAASESYTIYRSTTPGGPYTTPLATGVTTKTYADTTAVAGTTYYYTVQGSNNLGTGPVSNEASAGVSAPLAPTNLVGTLTTSAVSLTWTASAATSYYNVLRGTMMGGPYTKINTANVTATSYSDTTAPAGATYYYVVVAVNSFGTSPNSNEVSVTPVAPLPPTALTATGGNNAVLLTWTASAATTYYTVLRSPTTGGPYTKINTANVTTTTYTDTTAMNGATYYYVVTSTNNFGTSGNSNEASATPVPPVIGTGDGLFGAYYTGDSTTFAPIATTNPFFTEVEPTINLNTGNTGVANSPRAFPSQIPTTLFTQTGTQLPQHFSARFTGQFLSPVTGPVTFSVNEDDGGRMYVNGVLVFNDPNLLLPHTITATAVNMVAGQKYSVVLDYYNDGGGGTDQLFYAYPGQTAVIVPQTQLYSTLPAPSAPGSLTAVAPGPGIGLTWTGAFAATGYNVYRSTTMGGPYTKIATNIQTLSYGDSTTTLGTKYYYVVTGINNSGEGPYSNEASATPTKAAVIGTGDGLYGSYYFGTYPTPTTYDFTTILASTPSLLETDPVINFADAADAIGAPFSPGSFPTTGTFSAEWTGYFYAPVTANVTFTLISDDGSRLYFNGATTPVINSFVNQSPTITNSAPISVVAGTFYPVTIDYFNSGGGAQAQFAYSYPGLQLSIIPQTQLYSILPAPPTAPTGLTAIASATGINLAFTSVRGGGTYNVLRSTTMGGPYTSIAAGIATTKYTDTMVTAGTTYFYVVTATNSYGTGPNSNEASATPAAPLAPTNLTAFNGNNSVSLTWTASAVTATYNVLRSLSTGGPYTAIATGLTTTRYTDTAVTNGATYYYVVVAVNSFGTSPNSNEAVGAPVAPTEVLSYDFEGTLNGANPEPIPDITGHMNTGFALGGDEGITTDAAHGLLAGVIANDPNNQYLSLPSNFDFGNQFTFFCNTKLPSVNGDCTTIFSSHAVFGYGGWSHCTSTTRQP